MLRVCERLCLREWEFIQLTSEDQWRLLAFERIRQEEEVGGGSLAVGRKND